MKIKVIKDFYDYEANFEFVVGEVYKADNNELSDYYHIWTDTGLLIIPKKNCEIEKN